MSSLRNAVKRKTHKERAQPSGRKRLGLLEKKKDYVLRARDYESKKRRLSALKQRAAGRNPDEFYFKMVNTRTKRGVHESGDGTAQVPADVQKLLETQDMAYLRMKRAQEKSKVAKLSSNLHFIGGAPMNKHTVFVDSKDEAESFDAAEYFDTPSELCDRAFNRPRRSTLRKETLLGGDSGEKRSFRKLMKKRRAAYNALDEHLDREEKLDSAMEHLQARRNLGKKGKRFKVKDAEGGKPAVYVWKSERKR